MTTHPPMTPVEISALLKVAMERLEWSLETESKSALSESRYLAFRGDIPEMSPRGRAVWLRLTKAAKPFIAGYAIDIRVSDHISNGSRTTPHFSIFNGDQIARVTDAIALWNELAIWYPPAQPPREGIPSGLAFV